MTECIIDLFQKRSSPENGVLTFFYWTEKGGDLFFNLEASFEGVTKYNYVFSLFEDSKKIVRIMLRERKMHVYGSFSKDILKTTIRFHSRLSVIVMTSRSRRAYELSQHPIFKVVIMLNFCYIFYLDVTALIRCFNLEFLRVIDENIKLIKVISAQWLKVFLLQPILSHVISDWQDSRSKHYHVKRRQNFAHLLPLSHSARLNTIFPRLEKVSGTLS